MRIKNSIKNLGMSWLGYGLKIILVFVSRTVFIYVLNEEYLGLNGLFSNILSLLSLAELGIGTAIIFSLYKLIYDNDIKNIKAIMQFYKKVYISIGIIIGIVGISITPFLSLFIKQLPNIPNLTHIYILYVVNTAISYFFSYKSTFITANQKNYVVTLNNNIFSLLCVILQTVVLVITKNFILYLIIQVVFTLLSNIFISNIANKMYPFLLDKQNEKLDKKIFNDVLKNTGALLIHRIGAIVVFSTDNIILSKIVGIISVGIYSNYSMIINVVESFFNQVFQAISASVGELGVSESNSKKMDIFYITLFIDFWIYTFTSICLIVLLNPFIRMWIGQKYVFDFSIIIVLVLNFYIKGMRNSLNTFNSAFGTYWHNRYMPIPEIIINLVASIVLTKMYGVIGVFIGTTISSVTTCLWIEPYVLFKYGFNSSAKKYTFRYGIYFILASFLACITYVTCSIIPNGSFFSLFVKLFLCILIPNSIIILIFYKTREFKYLLGIIKAIVTRKRIS